VAVSFRVAHHHRFSPTMQEGRACRLGGGREARAMCLAAWASPTDRFSYCCPLPPTRLPAAAGAAGVGGDASGDDVWRLGMTAVMARPGVYWQRGSCLGL